jgi:hypothetical protein
MLRRLVLMLVPLLAGGCGLRPRPAPWTWAETRVHYVRRSQVWIGGDLERWLRHMRTLDLRAGPPGPGAFAPDELVGCAYRPPPAHVPLGNTPKFSCRRLERDADETFHVKYGEGNGEVYAEAAGTRLLWALGFPADRVYPVRVRCSGCAPDPWREREPRPGSSQTFAVAIVEREFPGVAIEEYPAQGWAWTELEAVDPAAGGAPRAHVDALKLLGAFVQHRDSKQDNQRLVCPDDAVVGAEAKGRTCRRPLMMIQDLGSVFGGQGLVFYTEKMNVAEWERQPVWSDARRCVANIEEEHDARGGLVYPQIGEEGRRFLGRLLEALDDRQLAALFEVARGERRGGVSRWVAAFRAKREEVIHPVPGEPDFHCPPER